jgi:hypothetical protein
MIAIDLYTKFISLKRDKQNRISIKKSASNKARPVGT